jgi:gliding motility-associated transport system permease protein
MTQVIPVFKREFNGYFRSPVAYVLLAAFVVLAAILWIFAGHFFDNRTASLGSFFTWMPWIFCVFIPAVAMRLWAEEKRSGTIELLMTLPVTTTEAVVGKFLAAWAFVGLGVVLTFPCVLTVAYLGDPDWGVIFTSYFGSLLMAGSFLGLCSLMSALTRNQVISFILSLIACLVLTFLGFNLFSDFLGSFAPVWLVDTVANFSFTTHFQAMTLGLIDLSSVVFFLSLGLVALIANVIVLER